MIFWLVVSLLCMLLMWFSVARMLETRIEVDHFAMDDEEFLRRCSPGTPRELALSVRRIVAEQLCIPYEHVYPDSRFIEDLGAD